MPSVYNKNRVTKKGYNLLAESIATKKPVTFTKVVIGDGDDNGLNIDTMTNVVSEKLILPVHEGQKDGDGQYLVTAILSNSTVEAGFFPKEVALFAKCGDGEEILYSYSNGGNNVGLIPDKNTPINSEIYNIRTKIGNATNITFLTSDDLYVTKSELTKHNTDVLSHPAITAMIAKILGATDWQENPISNLKDIKNLLGQGAIVASKLDANAGFVKYANGFTIQWGAFNNIPVGGIVNFPISFQKECYTVVGNDVNNNNKYNQVHSFRDYTKSTFKVFSQPVSSSATSSAAWGKYIAVGN